MSKVVNTAGMKAGSIYRIALKNFVTYKEVELFPGSSLNLIIGPNGTGKSTFVCAIILGLCGKTSVIGRAKKISEYVRSGCEEATIDIELYQDVGERNVIITRIFDLRDVTKWKIDHKTVREKQVQELIAAMNIQVDNLCQLLPQDRVQDFSKMDPQQLLRSTLAAVGGSESVEQLDELIKCRNEHRGLSTRLQNNAQLLEEKKRMNERLKVIIDTMQQRKEIEEEIAMCERKKYWLEYQELFKKVEEYKNDKDMAAKLVATHQRKIDPLEKMLGKARSGIGKLEQQKINAAREVRNLKEKLEKSIDSVKAQEYVIKDIEARLLERVEHHRNRERELLEARAKLDKLHTDKAKLAERAGNENGVKEELAELHRLIASANAAADASRKQRLEAEFDLDHNVKPQIRSYQNKIRQLENVDDKRLEELQRYSPDAYQAVLWLRDHRDMFQHNVYEPMMLEINFTDPKFARYLESRVANRDLFAFTFECSQDMSLFLTKVRQEGGLKRVNAVHSEGGSFRYQQNDISALSYLGFYTYMVDTISAPDPIIRYLCKNYNIHNIPIGNNHTYKNSSKVPDNIRLFFTENHRFSVRVSAYSGAKSNSTVEIGDARLLANTVDMEELENYREQLSNFEKKSASCVKKIGELASKVARLESNLNDLNTQRKRISDNVEMLKAIAVQIRLQAKKVQEIENEPAFNIQQEREKCRQQQQNVVMKQCKLHQELKGIMATLQNKLLNGEIWKVSLEISRDAIVQQESELRELKGDLNNAKTTLENITAHLSRAKTNARAKLLEAKKACGSEALPSTPGFPYNAQFEQLPSDLGPLQEHFYELQTRVDLRSGCRLLRTCFGT
ncbi:hypothetical protein MSG28_012621 [Choristoneura fumiferana]|uniref:Uncharacterized protein n=1 Tax=Choristoneura fumiferana TaxID=7141 RepID=A0ACC0JHC4_CHOFU|nr:hypothetical protein MSG28_012621 [Choristoneura fumiferana]